MSSHPPSIPWTDGNHCPVCASALERVHRHTLDRWASLFRSVHRYRCTSPDCEWEGVLGRDLKPPAAAAAVSWRHRAVWFLIGAAASLAAVQGARWVRHYATSDTRAVTAPSGAAALAASTPAGQDFHGEPLPAEDERVATNPSPLNLRRSCSWGVPGSNPYRGTVEQALAAARLPPEVVRKISDLAGRGWMQEQVEISRTGIRTMDRRRYFGRSAIAMGFGNTLCFDTRVNFKPGHVEYAALYEADDNRGQTYTVMVPYVCQNVAVLGQRRESDDVPEVPEPATLAMVLLALGLMAGVTWRRGRAGLP